MEREAYLDKEKPLPDFGRGDLVPLFQVVHSLHATWD